MICIFSIHIHPLYLRKKDTKPYNRFILALLSPFYFKNSAHGLIMILMISSK